MRTYGIVFLLTAWTALGLCSCSTREPAVQTNGEPIALSASIGPMETRVDDGQIVSGSYRMTYYSTPDTRSICPVSFAQSKGYPLLVDEEGVYRFLKWNDVTPVASRDLYLFTLDNLDNGTDPGTVTLDESYRAAPLSDAPELDIVWGSRSVALGSEHNAVAFTLSHRMTKLSVEIRVNSSGIVLDGKEVRITLVNIIDLPATFNRASGTVETGSHVPTDVVLYEGVLTQSDDKYVIPSSWIFPPQRFDSQQWPRLRLEFDGTTYEGTLNHFMIEEGADLDTPIEMFGLEAGLHLTLRAGLSRTADDIELVFMPVWVKKWEEIENIGITAKQRGIYTEGDYRSLVEAYNSEPKNSAALEKYGTLEAGTGRWSFTLYKRIGTAEGAADMPKFKDDDFDLSFNGYTIYGYGTKEELVAVDPDGGNGNGGE